MNSTTVSKMCEGCGDWIPAKRLAAKPNATLCVTCQESRDILPSASIARVRRSFLGVGGHNRLEQHNEFAFLGGDAALHSSSELSN